jgi:hypothetical protein
MRGAKQAVIAMAAVAAAAIPATAQATEWTVDGVRSNATTEVAGLITLVPTASSLRVSCFVNLGVSHTNTLTAANVSITSANFVGCETNIANCTVTAGPTSLPWNGTASISGGVSRVSVALSFSNTFGSGCPSPLTSQTFSETGTLSPSFDPVGQSLLLDGTSASGSVSGPLGTAKLDGGFDLRVTSPADGILGLV